MTNRRLTLTGWLAIIDAVLLIPIAGLSIFAGAQPRAELKTHRRATGSYFFRSGGLRIAVPQISPEFPLSFPRYRPSDTGDDRAVCVSSTTQDHCTFERRSRNTSPRNSRSSCWRAAHDSLRHHGYCVCDHASPSAGHLAWPAEAICLHDHRRRLLHWNYCAISSWAAHPCRWRHSPRDDLFHSGRRCKRSGKLVRRAGLNIVLEGEGSGLAMRHACWGGSWPGQPATRYPSTIPCRSKAHR